MTTAMSTFDWTAIYIYIYIFTYKIICVSISHNSLLLLLSLPQYSCTKKKPIKGRKMLTQREETRGRNRNLHKALNDKKVR